MGRIQGKHPGLKTLTAWARATLHPSLTLLSLKSNNFFEVTFANQEGRLHALKQTDLTCESSAIFFSSWRPHVNSGNVDKLDHPVWVQVVNLCQILREDSFLRTIGEQLGQVIDIDNSDIYKAKLYGPRMRILVQDINNLPQLLVLPRLDGEGVVEYTLAYSGLPHQCGRCRSRDHQVRNCPRKDTTGGKQEQKTNQRTKKRERAPRPVGEVLKSRSPAPISVPENVSPTEAVIDHVPGGLSRWQPKTKSVAEVLKSSRPEPILVPDNAEASVAPIPERLSSWQPKPASCSKNEDVSLLPPTEPPVQQETDGRPQYSIQLDQEGTLEAAKDDQIMRATQQESPAEVTMTPLVLQRELHKAQCVNDSSQQGEERGAVETVESEPAPAAPIPEDDNVAMLVPDEINFPRLPSPAKLPLSPSPCPWSGHTSPTPSIKMPQTAEKTATPVFIWRSPPGGQHLLETMSEKEGGKIKDKPSIPRAPDSAPITRQGYRTGRLAEDFWGTLGIPNTPSSIRKTLRVIPFLIKNSLTEQAEYLVDKKILPFTTLVQVHVAEVLAGVPWSTTRAKQHIVNEISHALHRVLIFNNNLSNPFQKWNQGCWFVSWVEDAEGEHTCTLLVSVVVLESKIKPRKGQNFQWQPVPAAIREQIAGKSSEMITLVDEQQWSSMMGKHQPNLAVKHPHRTATSNLENTPSSAVLNITPNER